MDTKYHEIVLSNNIDTNSQRIWLGDKMSSNIFITRSLKQENWWLYLRVRRILVTQSLWLQSHTLRIRSCAGMSSFCQIQIFLKIYSLESIFDFWFDRNYIFIACESLLTLTSIKVKKTYFLNFRVNFFRNLAITYTLRMDPKS